jgi:hypothetical protein
MKSFVAVQKKLLILIYTLWKKNEPYNEMGSESRHQTNGIEIHSDLTGEKRRFPAIGRELQGKPPYEMAVSSQME